MTFFLLESRIILRLHHLKTYLNLDRCVCTWLVTDRHMVIQMPFKYRKKLNIVNMLVLIDCCLMAHEHHFSFTKLKTRQSLTNFRILNKKSPCVHFIIGLNTFFPEFIYVSPGSIHSQTNKNRITWTNSLTSKRRTFICLWVNWSRLCINKLRKNAFNPYNSVT